MKERLPILAGGYSTAAALPVIVKELKKRGYKFVRLDELIGKRPAPPPQGKAKP